LRLRLLRPASPQKICPLFPENLFLKNQKIEFTPQTQWAALSAALKKVGEIPLCNILVDFLSAVQTYYVSNG
jgi:hypothetical protein